MKRCPTCNKSYTDDNLSFCPSDGTPLITDQPLGYDPQATIMATPPKVTSPTSGPFGSDQPGAGGDWPSQSPAQNDWASQTPAQAPPQTDWPSAPPPAPSDWGSPSAYQPGSQPMGSGGFATPPPPPFPGAAGKDKTLAIWSLVLGILSLFCFGIVTGPIAIVLGVMALNKEKNDPARYGGGKGLAYAGIGIGAFAVLLTLLFLLIALAGGFR